MGRPGRRGGSSPGAQDRPEGQAEQQHRPGHLGEERSGPRGAAAAARPPRRGSARGRGGGGRGAPPLPAALRSSPATARPAPRSAHRSAPPGRKGKVGHLFSDSAAGRGSAQSPSYLPAQGLAPPAPPRGLSASGGGRTAESNQRFWLLPGSEHRQLV